MTEREKKKFDAVPDVLKPAAELYLAKSLSEISKNPQQGKWYRFTPDDCICANGEPYHGCIKLGSENKLAIMFCGGGTSINEYTAARPITFYKKPDAEAFYFNDVFIIADASTNAGVYKDTQENPFRDWTMLFVPYATGDFHCGTGDFLYTSVEEKQEILHHHGYKNYKALVNYIKKLIPSPEKILVTGYSAGGFGTALLTGDVMNTFPKCQDVTCLVDSALLLFDGWRNTARDVWKAPKKIYERLNGNNITLDSLKALFNNYSSIVKIMFISSVRDAALITYQNFVDCGKMIPSIEGGKNYAANLNRMCVALQQAIPDVGLYFFDTLTDDVSAKEMKLTQHCLINSPALYTTMIDGKSAIDWIWDGVNGKIEKIGMALLEEKTQEF